MDTRPRWLVVAAVAILIVVVLLWRGCRDDGDRQPMVPADFVAESAELVSPDLDLELLVTPLAGLPPRPARPLAAEKVAKQVAQILKAAH